MHDENVYSDPFKFDPARYLGDQITGVNSPAFGFGRRSVICGGLSRIESTSSGSLLT